MRAIEASIFLIFSGPEVTGVFTPCLSVPYANTSKMKLTLTLPVLLAIPLLLFACGQGASAEKHQEGVGLVLDNGQKWKANPETTTGVANMVQLVDSFTDTESRTAYATLKTQLEDEFTMIFKQCTMKGEAHNQLHTFLLPLKPLFKELASSNLSTSQESLAKLKMHLAEYTNYFE